MEKLVIVCLCVADMVALNAGFTGGILCPTAQRQATAMRGAHGSTDKGSVVLHPRQEEGQHLRCGRRAMIGAATVAIAASQILPPTPQV